MSFSVGIVGLPNVGKFPILSKFYCYVLKSLQTGDYYIGSTEDREKRLQQHNKGLVRSTKYGVPWKMVYFETFDSLKVARNRELQIKKWKSRKAIERLLSNKI